MVKLTRECLITLPLPTIKKKGKVIKKKSKSQCRLQLEVLLFDEANHSVKRISMVIKKLTKLSDCLRKY